MFSRNTIIKLIECLHFHSHGEVSRFALKFALEGVVTGSTLKERETVSIYYLCNFMLISLLV